jgi:transcriptional regulator with XRE-family HTH domain
MDYQSCARRNGILAALGLNVRRQREAKQLTLEKLAELAGLDPTYISGIERGRRNPGIKNVARLAKVLGLTASELCKGVDA